MSPEDVRATDRVARQHRQQHVQEDDICRAFASSRQRAPELVAAWKKACFRQHKKTRKRRLDALEAEEVPEEGNVGTHVVVAENCAADQAHEPVYNDFLDFLGV
jgi:hypothetical protein